MTVMTVRVIAPSDRFRPRVVWVARQIVGYVAILVVDAVRLRVGYEAPAGGGAGVVVEVWLDLVPAVADAVAAQGKDAWAVLVVGGGLGEPVGELALAGARLPVGVLAAPVPSTAM
jgi:hypothetical protein